MCLLVNVIRDLSVERSPCGHVSVLIATPFTWNYELMAASPRPALRFQWELRSGGKGRPLTEDHRLCKYPSRGAGGAAMSVPVYKAPSPSKAMPNSIT